MSHALNSTLDNLYNLYKLVESEFENPDARGQLRARQRMQTERMTPDLPKAALPTAGKTPQVDAAQATSTLSELEQDLARLQRSIRLTIAEKLNQFAGQAFPTLEENRKLVDTIAQLIDSHGLRVRCSECGHPAILRVSPRGNSSGVFVFDHTIDNRRTFHGGKSRLPVIHLVAKPPRRKASKKLAS
ncbi:hypothetical protein N9N28_10615 [Rubripirellula amarantea]|uniref:hypothetical protein n=1 Tax=Rubripirellula amarantea TaxID=2527999 RepID=UPI001F5E370D|nr:hypothetical protein [Rubripirellula amarantea]MDA8745073.1 hypothetical protein [Rubripirellula amarantea]